MSFLWIPWCYVYHLPVFFFHFLIFFFEFTCTNWSFFLSPPKDSFFQIQNYSQTFQAPAVVLWTRDRWKLSPLALFLFLCSDLPFSYLPSICLVLWPELRRGFIYTRSGGVKPRFVGFVLEDQWGGRGFGVVGVGFWFFSPQIFLSLCRTCRFNGGWGLWCLTNSGSPRGQAAVASMEGCVKL